MRTATLPKSKRRPRVIASVRPREERSDEVLSYSPGSIRGGMSLPLRLAAVAHQANPQRSKGSPPRAAQRRGLCRLPPLGAPAGCLDGLVRFADLLRNAVEWRRNLCSRNEAEWRGGKLRSPSRARADPCQTLARSASFGSMRPGITGCRWNRLALRLPPLASAPAWFPPPGPFH